MSIESFSVAAIGFLAIIFLIVIIHEFGHYLAARAFGIKPRVFSMGMGPEIFAKIDKNGTRWKVCALPVGGYVKFHGDMHPSPDNPEASGDFAKMPRWKRAIVVAAGPIINLVLAATLFLGIASAVGYYDTTNIVESIKPGSTAEQAGIKPGDKLVGWNGDDSVHMRSFTRSIRTQPDTTHQLVFERNGKEIEKTIKAEKVEFVDQFGTSHKVGEIGITFPTYIRGISGIGDVIDVTVNETKSLFNIQVSAAYQILTGKRGVEDLSGPVRMAKMSGEQLSLGWMPYIYFAGLVSIAIAFMNFLPIPGLDGGYLALYAYEGTINKDLGAGAIKKFAITGYAMIGVIFAIAITNDVRFILSF